MMKSISIAAMLASAMLSLSCAAPVERPQAAQWVTLGVAGGPPLHAEEAQISNALVIGDAIYLFDVGNGVLRQLDAAGLDPRNVRAVFVSHYHIDHSADLGVVLIQHWLNEPNETLTVIGPRGLKTLTAGIVAGGAPMALASFPVSGPPRPPMAASIDAIEVEAMAVPTAIYKDENISVSAIDVDHFQVAPAQPLAEMPRAVGYRIAAGGRVFVFSGDTGPSKNLETLARGADVLISEVVSLDGIEEYLRRSIANAPPGLVDALVANMAKNHLTPEAVGEIATAAGVNEVVLTHYVPAVNSPAARASLIEGVRAIYHGPVRAAEDLDRF